MGLTLALTISESLPSDRLRYFEARRARKTKFKI